MLREFPCSADGLLGAQAFLESVCEEPKPAIVMDEIVSNIVRCSGATGFTIDLSNLEDGGMKMVFSDDGVPFDPTHDVKAPDVTVGIEDREIGGLGIHMVKKMSKSVGYVREAGKNILTVVM